MLRRSARHQAASYDANGRDYLAGQLTMTRPGLEAWLFSPSVHQHLLLWYNLCVLGRRRYNEAAGWINFGEGGYFYDEQGLEGNLLLLCLGEGNIEKGTSSTTLFADATTNTNQWPAEQLWARAAWRVVQYNSGPGQIFEQAVFQHPAAAYALAIDVLCIAFHSIAYRQQESVWHELIGASITSSTTTTAIELDQSDETQDDEMASRIEVDAVSLSDSDSTCEGADSDFVAPKTPDRLGDSRLATPNAPRKSSHQANRDARVRNWVDTL
ncbi:hypothetical protein Slin15195_G032090 [Septoria linicola]|uniref:Uncharacterized protein n=1 Tax=Septoria linicola TaxID=215465 RepID=A0A9Q9EGE2_9PEZI|nr:hypothetical protein Slin14017_G031110 [Septoria linicola]USW49890.1 hypothetical protein Slin15195_G032090 [Septoria linicola]